MVREKIIDVYGLPPVFNVCNQTLREIISLPKVSVAHVVMEEGDISLLHKHSDMDEVYFIIKGKGVVFQGNKRLIIEKDSYSLINKQISHKLSNNGKSKLEHLVFAIPPFNPKDVEILEDKPSREVMVEKFKNNNPKITASDGATIYELLNGREREELGMALAIGFLPKGRKAIPHYHNISEELYYILSGSGKIRIGSKILNIKKDSVAYIPTRVVHALENTNNYEPLKVLCVSSPSYQEKDFLFEK